MNSCKKYFLILLFSIAGFRADITTEQFLAVPEIRDLWNEIKKRNLIFRNVDLEITSYSSYTPPEAKDFDQWSCWLQAPLAPIIHERTAGIIPLNQMDVMKVFGTRDLPGLAGNGTEELFVPDPQGTFFDLFDQSFWQVLTGILWEKIQRKEGFNPNAVLLYFAACSARQACEKQLFLDELRKRNSFLNLILLAARDFSILEFPPAFVFSKSGKTSDQSVRENQLCFCCKQFLFVEPNIAQHLVFLKSPKATAPIGDSINLLGLFSRETLAGPIRLIIGQRWMHPETQLLENHCFGVMIDFNQNAKTLDIFIFDSSEVDADKMSRDTIRGIKNLLLVTEKTYGMLNRNRTKVLTNQNLVNTFEANLTILKDHIKNQLTGLLWDHDFLPLIGINGKIFLSPFSCST